MDYNSTIFGIFTDIIVGLIGSGAWLSMLILAFAAALGIFGVSQALSVVNQEITRTIFLTGEVVREEYVVRAKFADEPAQFHKDVPAELAAEIHENWFPNYVVVVPSASAKQLAGFDAAQIEVGDTTIPLQINEITSEMQNCDKFGFRCLSVQFPPSQKIEKEIKFAVSFSFINQVTTKPAVRKDMAAPLQLLYKSESIDPISAYKTAVSRTILAISQSSKSLRLRCPIGRKPEKVNHRLPFNMKGFSCLGTEKGPVELHIESRDAQMLRIKSLTRRLTYMPWDNSIQVSESYEVIHDGFKASESPKFDRLEFSRIIQRNKGNLQGTQIMPQIILVVPKAARGIQIRDEVGINWAYVQRTKISADDDVVNVPFRFPLTGGMTSSFDFHYTIPASTLISPFQSQASPFKKLFQMHIAHLAVDSPIEKLKVIVSLPEDSTDVEHELGTSKAVHFSRRLQRSYFSTIGEKELTFEFENITRDESEKMMAILFNYPWWGIFRKPIVALISFIALLASLISLSKTSFALTPSSPEKQKRSQLRKLFGKRRELLLDVEDLIAVNVNAKPNAEQQKADAENQSRLVEQIRTIEGAIFEKVKVNAKDPQMNTLNAMALKRLYDDQIGLVRRILAEVCSRPNGSNSSVDSVQNFSSRGSLSSVQLSKSGSGDLLKRPQMSENLKALNVEAANIDSQISLHEAKFL